MCCCRVLWQHGTSFVEAGKPMARKRVLSDEEHALWASVATRARPLKGKKPAVAPLPGKLARPALALTKAIPPVAAQSRPSSHFAVPSPRTLEASLKRRLHRGQLEPEARLDLHGHSAERAHGALSAFISGARSQGRKLVLVVTGKGGSSYGRHTLQGRHFCHGPEPPGGA